MPLLGIAPSNLAILVGIVLAALGGIVAIFLCLIYGLKRIIEGIIKPDKQMKLSHVLTILIAAFFGLLSLMIIVTDESTINKSISWAVMAASLAVIGIKVKQPKEIQAFQDNNQKDDLPNQLIERDV